MRRICSIVAFASEVSVLVMVWTEIGASPPTGTDPTWICRLGRRAMSRQGLMLLMGSKSVRSLDVMPKEVAGHRT